MGCSGDPEWIRTTDPKIRHTTTFVATSRWKCLCAGLSLHHANRAVGLDAARQVSTPSPFGAWLGIAILQVSPTLMSFHPKVSLRGRKNNSTNAMLYQLS